MSASGTIGILGGTFDPVHIGHLAIARSFLESSRIDELWVLLTPAPPHKGDRTLTPYDLRMEMLKTAFRRISRTRISDLERRLKRPSYSWRTLAYLKKNHPDRQFVLCIGEDSLEGFTRWKRWEQILEMVPLLVAERPRTDHTSLPEPLRERTMFVEHTPVEISSTVIRSELASGGSAAQWLPEGVGEIIHRNSLYRRNRDE